MDLMPHDISGKWWRIPAQREGQPCTLELMEKRGLLESHPVNIERRQEDAGGFGVVLGAGQKPVLDSFADKYGCKAQWCTVDLVRPGICAGCPVFVPGATGRLRPFCRQARAPDELLKGQDFVYAYRITG